MIVDENQKPNPVVIKKIQKFFENSKIGSLSKIHFVPEQTYDWKDELNNASGTLSDGPTYYVMTDKLSFKDIKKICTFKFKTEFEHNVSILLKPESIELSDNINLPNPKYEC